VEKTINVLGMHCKSCKILIEDVVLEVEGVQGVEADFESGKVVVKYSDENAMQKIKDAIEKEGYHIK